MQFIFWLLVVVCGIPHLRALVQDTQTREDLVPYYFTSYIIFFVLATAIWFLNWFADIAPLSTKYAKSDVRINIKSVLQAQRNKVVQNFRNHVLNSRPAIHPDYFLLGLIRSHGWAIANHYNTKTYGI